MARRRQGFASPEKHELQRWSDGEVGGQQETSSAEPSQDKHRKTGIQTYSGIQMRTTWTTTQTGHHQGDHMGV